MAISKFWLDKFWELMGMGGGLVTLQPLLINKNGTSPFNFQSNEPFSKFLRQQMAIKKLSIRCISGKYEVGGGNPPFGHSES